jgi:hypothetical protein
MMLQNFCNNWKIAAPDKTELTDSSTRHLHICNIQFRIPAVVMETYQALIWYYDDVSFYSVRVEGEKRSFGKIKLGIFPILIFFSFFLLAISDRHALYILYRQNNSIKHNLRNIITMIINDYMIWVWKKRRKEKFSNDNFHLRPQEKFYRW